jgi:hypothetical protein
MGGTAIVITAPALKGAAGGHHHDQLRNLSLPAVAKQASAAP